MQNMTTTNMNNEILNIKETLNKMNNEISSNILTKLYEIKQSYTDDLKIILANNQNDNINKIIDKIEKENNNIIDKTNSILNDIVPKSFNNFHINYENIINDFKRDITNKNISFDKINDILEQKYNNLILSVQQSLINYNNNYDEKLNEIKMMTSINTNSQDKINNQLLEYLNKYKNSSQKGNIGEIKLETILNKLFSNAEIIKTISKTSSGDFIVKRENKPTILFENKDYNYQVDKSEISKFIIDIENNDCHGIFLSQYSGITNKKNYQIEYHKGKILIFLNFVEYNSDRISIAIDIIDDLFKKLNLVNNNNILTDDLLEHINNEYSLFATKKEYLMTYLKETNKKSIELLTDFELPTLANYLSTKFATTKLNNFICEYCEFVGKNRMSLASHKKYCNKNPNKK